MAEASTSAPAEKVAENDFQGIESMAPDANASAVPDYQEEQVLEPQPEGPEGELSTPESLEEAPAEQASDEFASTDQDIEQEGESPAGYDDLLPREQRKDYPEELLQLAAKKFGVPAEEIQKPYIRSLLVGKINSDIAVRNYRELEKLAEEEGEEGEEENQPAQLQQKYTPEQIMQAANQLVAPMITDEGAALYTQASADAWNKLTQAMETGDEQAAAEARREITQSQMAFLAVALSQILPEVLPRLLGGDNLESALNARISSVIQQREQLRTEHQTARNALSKDPRYGPDLARFIKSGELLRFVQENPEILNKQFRDPVTKKPLSRVENIMAQYRFVVNALRGEKASSTELVHKGIQAGKQKAEADQQRKNLGRLMPGRSRGQINPTPNLVRDMVERYKAMSEGSNPLGSILSKT